MTEAADHTCTLCARIAFGRTEHDVYADDEWLVSTNPDYGRPGALWVVARRHVDGVWALTDDQARSFGSVARAAAEALHGGLGAERVYMVALGENHPHFHVLLIMRSADDGERGLALVGTHLAKGGSPDDAADFAGRVRAGFVAPPPPRG